MRISTTKNFNLPFVFAGQFNKDIAVNEAFFLIDFLLQGRVISVDYTWQPESPNDGDSYLIPQNAEDIWADYKQYIAVYNTTKGWVYIPPSEGLRFFVNDKNAEYIFKNNSWIENTHTTIADYEHYGLVKIGNGFKFDEWGKLAVNISNNLTDADPSKSLSAEQGVVLKNLIDNINTLLTSDDSRLDQLQEIVNYIKQNKEILNTLSVSNIVGLQDALNLKANQNDVNTLQNAIANKVDNATGKGLSTNDFTNEYKSKVENIINDNLIINGDFQIWQRGTVINVDSALYTADRWLGQHSQVTRENNSTENPFDSQYFLRCNVNSLGAFKGMQYLMPSYYQFIGQTLTLSFWYKMNEGDAPLMFQIENAPDGFGYGVFEHFSTLPHSTEWTKKILTFTIRDLRDRFIESKAGIRIILRQRNGGTSPIDFSLGQVKLEIGELATKFVTKNYSDELRDCQGFFERIPVMVNGFAESSTIAKCAINFSRKRAVPTLSYSSANGFTVVSSGGSSITNTVNFNNISSMNAECAFGSSDLIAGQSLYVKSNVDEYIDIDCEV